MKNTIHLLIASVFSSLGIQAQSFDECVIVYKADSVFNNNLFDYTSREIKLYKRNNLYRLENIKKSLRNEFPIELDVQLINEKGKYVFKDSSKIMEHVAFFITLEQEKQLQSQRILSGDLEIYKIQKIEKQKKAPNSFSEIVTIIGSKNRRTEEILVSKSLKTQFGLFFEKYRNLQGTPLQFYEDEGGRMIHYKAVQIKKTKLSSDMFYIDENYEITPFLDLYLKR